MESIDLGDAFGVVAFGVDPFSELAGLVVDEGVVHEVEPLHRDVGGEALLGGEGRVGEVEGLQEGVDAEAADLARRRCGAVFSVVKSLAGPPASSVSRSPATKRMESRSCSASRRCSGEVRVERLCGSFSCASAVSLAALLVDGGQHDHRCSFLSDMPFVAELDGEVVEKLRVGGRIADLAEVIRRVDDAGAEVPLPDAVDEDARWRAGWRRCRRRAQAGRCPGCTAFCRAR